MRVSFVFSTLICMHLALWANSQNTLSLTVKKVSLKDVFELIERQSDYRFLYSDNPVFENKKITIAIQGASLDKIMQNLLQGTGIAYKLSNNNLVVLSRSTGAVNNETAAFKLVTGTVTDEKGTPLNGVSVTVQGTSKGTSTNNKGGFTIDAKQGDVLEFSFVGYKAVSILVGNEENFTLKMTTDVSGLGEVVIVGYGTQKKVNLTGAVASVKMDEVLGNRPVSTTASLVQGIIPGLQVTIGSGEPGASASFNIRGATGLNTSGSSINTDGPLILVDNVPFNGPLNLIDPNDIETFTVLKDAGSAAIYGGRSAFGVILITTKKGIKNQKAQFTYSNNITFSSPVNLPQKPTPLQTVRSFQDMGTTAYWTGQNVTTWLQLLKDYQANPSNYPGGYAFSGGIRYQLAENDVMGNLLGNSAAQFQHNFSVNGGSDKTTYRITLGTVNENGILAPGAHQDKYARYNVKSVISSDITSWFTAQADAGYYRSVKTSPFNNIAFDQAANVPSFSPITDTITSATGISGPNGSPKNLIALGSPSTTQNDDIRITGRTIFRPVKGLTVTGEYTFDNLRVSGNSYDKLYAFVNQSNFTNSNGGTGTYSLSQANTDYSALNIYANYQKTFGRHNIAVMAGFNQEESTFKQNTASRDGMIAADFPSITQATGTINASNSYSSFALKGYFGRINYDYKGRYLLEVNGRYDGSSKFPEGHRWGFFPSASAGWRVSEESFMQHFKSWLSEFKLRASLGQVGNQNISPYAFIPTMAGYNTSWLTGTTAYQTSLTTPGLISADFTWETVKTLDYGVDFGLLKNRLYGSFDWYKRETKGILAAGAIPLPGVLGTTAPLQNTASLRSQGYEIQLNWRDKIGKINYRIGINLYDYQAEITRFDGNPTGNLSSYYVGQKLGSIWGYTTDRLYTINDFAAGSLNSSLTGGTLNSGIVKFQGENPNPGDIAYKDLNKDGIVYSGKGTLSDPGDRSIIGNSSLRYQYGVTGGVSCKNFDFSFVLSGVAKQDMWLSNVLTLPNQYAFGTIYAHQLNYWTPTNTDAFYSRLYNQAGGNQSFNQSVQTRYLLNGAYLKIKNITLSYSVSAALLKRIHLSRLQVFCSGENIVTFDHLPAGLDPTVTDKTVGGRGFGYPFMRMVSTGVNLSF